MDAPANILHLRHSNSGRPKDWIAIPSHNHLDIYFGSTSKGITGPRQFGDTTGLTKKTIQTIRPIREANSRAKAKLAKGYRQLFPDRSQARTQQPSQPDPTPDPVALWQQGTSESNNSQDQGGTNSMNIPATPTDVPTVQSLFHQSFPPVSWTVRDQHEWQAYVPTPTNYHFRPEVTADFLGWWSFGGLSCLISGPTGSGKSSLVNEVAARSNQPVFSATGHNRLELIDLIGQYIPNAGGGFTFEYGPLPMAMKSGGVFLFDEIDLVDPSTLVGLNSILDGRPLTLSANGGEVIHPEASFRFIATANTTGQGEGEANGYSGTLKMSKAFMNRLKWTFLLDYPEPDVEIDILQQLLGNRDISEKMVTFAGEIRKIHTAEENPIPDTLSTRELVEWAKASLFFRQVPRVKHPIAHALKYTVLNRASQDGKPILREVYQRIFNQEL
ncbi:AAA family ATPase [Desulfonatronum parangueonense]